MKTREERFNIYLDVFIQASITLDLLKAIVVRDLILKTDLGKSLDKFPSFLVLDGDVSESIYDETMYKVNSVEIKLVLVQLVSYIEQSLFAQDIALLNEMSVRFTKSINVNTDANARLQLELSKLDSAKLLLDAKLLEAKKLQTVYDILKNQMETLPDPVSAYNEQIVAKINAEIEAQGVIARQIRDQEIAEAEALAREEQIKIDISNQAKAQQALLDQQLSEAAIAKAREEALYQENLVRAGESKSISDSVSNSTSIDKTLNTSETIVNKKKSKVVPIALGVGLLAYFGLKE